MFKKVGDKLYLTKQIKSKATERKINFNLSRKWKKKRIASKRISKSNPLLGLQHFILANKKEKVDHSLVICLINLKLNQ